MLIFLTLCPMNAMAYNSEYIDQGYSFWYGNENATILSIEDTRIDGFFYYYVNYDTHTLYGYISHNATVENSITIGIVESTHSFKISFGEGETEFDYAETYCVVSGSSVYFAVDFTDSTMTSTTNTFKITMGTGGGTYSVVRSLDIDFTEEEETTTTSSSSSSSNSGSSGSSASSKSSSSTTSSNSSSSSSSETTTKYKYTGSLLTSDSDDDTDSSSSDTSDSSSDSESDDSSEDGDTVDSSEDIITEAYETATETTTGLSTVAWVCIIIGLILLVAGVVLVAIWAIKSYKAKKAQNGENLDSIDENRTET